MLDQLQRKLKEFIRQSEQDKLFILLGKCLRNDSELSDKFAIQEGQLTEANSQYINGLINEEGLRNAKAKINFALLSLIRTIQPADLNDVLRQKLETFNHISVHHVFSCDRKGQYEKVLEVCYVENPDKKVRHFFLHGDSHQEHEGFFNRVHGDIAGLTDNWEDPAAQPSVKKKVYTCQPDCKNASVYKIQFLLKLLDKIRGVDPRLRSTLAGCTLKDLVNYSELKDLSASDYVFVLLKVNNFTWSDQVPKAIDILTQSFFDCILPENAPGFFFFYSFEYDENKTDVKKAIQNEVRSRADRIVELPELQDVRDDDVNEWFSLYPRLIPKGMSAESMAAWLFGNRNYYKMKEVKDKLLQLIEKNKIELDLEAE
jgi:hypothetical protein